MNAILNFGHSAAHETASPSDIVSEANHRIANSLTLLVSMVRMQAVSLKKKPGTFSNAEVRMLLEGVAARISTISQLHRMMSHIPYEGPTSLRPHLREVCDALVSALSSAEQQVRVEHSGMDCTVLMRHVQPIVLVLCEVFLNAMKYAHPTGVPLVISVDCALTSDGQFVLSLCDDGVGLPDGFDPMQSQGLGFRVMRSLAAEIGAMLAIESTELGLCFRMTLPNAVSSPVADAKMS
jgi:two-component sensor histidine kinase